jgi:glucosamine kinase
VKPLVIGVDAGGSNTRAMVATLDGQVLGVSAGGAGNPVSVGAAAAAGNVLDTIVRALGDQPPATVRAIAMGSAGGGASAEFDHLLIEGLAGAGVRASLAVRPDLEAAFGSGTAERDGYALIAGTGATAGRIEGTAMVQSIGGAGWLLGDEGSGFWLGREAVRAALADCDGSGPPTKLTDQIAGTLGCDRGREEIIAAVYARPPIWLATVAPIVTGAAVRGDLAALSIVDSAAVHLAELMDGLHPTAGQPVVLIGGVVSEDSPVAARLIPRLTAAGLACTVVQNGAPGATWLALLSQRPDAGPAVHARLLAGRL